MQKILEEIWSSYQMEHPNETNEEKIKLQKSILECENRLFRTMTPEQVEIFSECEEKMNKCESIAEREAFAIGVRFAARFFMEVLCSK